MKPTPIREAWLSYSKCVLPSSAPSAQIIECRRAFYAGAQAFFATTMNCFDPSTPEATDNDLALLSAMEEELKNFCQQVKDGVA